MQDHVYVQHLELATFQSRFRELAASLASLEEASARLPAPRGARSEEDAAEIDACLDAADACGQALQVEQARARELARLGQELLQEHHFAADCVQPKCAEVRAVCQRLEAVVAERRRLLHRWVREQTQKVTYR